MNIVDGGDVQEGKELDDTVARLESRFGRRAHPLAEAELGRPVLKERHRGAGLFRGLDHRLGHARRERRFSFCSPGGRVSSRSGSRRSSATGSGCLRGLRLPALKTYGPESGHKHVRRSEAGVWKHRIAIPWGPVDDE